MKNMKRIASMILVLALIVACCGIPAFAKPAKYLKTTAKCYLRLHADKNSKKLDALSEGEQLVSYQDMKDSRGVTWYKVTYNDKDGWISSKNLKVINHKPDPQPTKKPSKKASHKKYVVVTGSCNIRKAPSKSAKKIGIADKGDFWKCTGAKFDDRDVVWYRFTFNGNDAWVSSRYSKTTNTYPEGNHTVKPVVTPKPINYASFKIADYYVQVTSSTLNMRFEPAVDSSIIHVYNFGEVLYAMRTNGEWVEVLDEEANRSGYVSAKYVTEYTFDEEIEEDSETTTSNDNEVNNIEELQAAVPFATLIDAPEGSVDVKYSWHYIGLNDIHVAQVAFTLEGIPYVLRAAACKSVDEMVDIDGQDAAPELEDGELHVIISSDNTTAVAHYFNEELGTQYSLSGPSANHGALVEEMAKQLFIHEAPNVADFGSEEEAA